LMRLIASRAAIRSGKLCLRKPSCWVEHSDYFTITLFAKQNESSWTRYSQTLIYQPPDESIF
jgi:hypothetical protein